MSLSINLDSNGQANSSAKLHQRNSSLNLNLDQKSNSKNKTNVRPNSKGKGRFRNVSKKQIIKLTLLVLLISIIGGGSYLWWRATSAAAKAGVEIKATDIINPIKDDPELKKDSSGKYTNALLVGIDTREENKGLLNTDTMIVASYNHETGETIMYSIPRDFVAELPGQQWYVKSNSIYGTFEQEEEGTGLPKLQESLEDVLGLEIQYYGMVDLKAFTDIIDLIGGIQVDVENSFTDYNYPAPAGSAFPYQTVSFEAGPQRMDGDTALQYARSRKSLDNGEGSDFARAKRQQNVINAAIDSVMSTDVLLSPNKIFEILDTLSGNVKFSQISTSDIQAAINTALEAEDFKTYSFVLSPAIANGQIVTTGVTANQYSIGPSAGLGKYEDINRFVQLSLENPALYEADPTIVVYDTGIGYAAASQRTQQLKEQYPYIEFIFAGTLFTDKQGDVIYDNTADGSQKTVVDLFNAKGDWDAISKPSYITTILNAEDVSILLGQPIPEPTPEPSSDVPAE